MSSSDSEINQATAVPTEAPRLNKPREPCPSSRRWLWFKRISLGLLATVVLILVAGWIWAGTDGTLATALQWAGRATPVKAEGISGSIRHGGHVRHLKWSQNGLTIDVDDAQLNWRSWALLGGRLYIEHMGASRVVIAEHSPKSAQPSAGPPESLTLPLKIQIDQVAVKEILWEGPPNYSLQDVAAQYEYDGEQHLLTLKQARIQGGVYQAHARVDSHQPLQIKLTLSGAIRGVPGAQDMPSFYVQGTAVGLLSDMQAQLVARAITQGNDTSDSTSTETDLIAGLPPLPKVPKTAKSLQLPEFNEITSGQPTVLAAAHVTLWATQPLPQALAHIHALDLAQLLQDTPQTSLNGTLELDTLSEPNKNGWDIHAHVVNALPAPWDQHKLPLEEVNAHIQWADEVATVHELLAKLAGGTLSAHGRWSADAASQQGWQMQGQIQNVNPAALHTQLAMYPIDGTVLISGAGHQIGFNVALQAQAQRVKAARRHTQDATPMPTNPLQALHLRQAKAQGDWKDGLLTINQLWVEADNAHLKGSAKIHPFTPSGTADLSLAAPGMTLQLKGDAQPDQGAGTLSAKVTDLHQLVVWARQLPGAHEALDQVQAEGQGALQGRWKGGWRHPTLQLQLYVPQVDWNGAGAANKPPSEAWVQLRQFQAALTGTFEKAQFKVSGQVKQGQRRAELRLQAQGGRTTPNASLTNSNWKLLIQQLQLNAAEPTLGEGTWRLASQGEIPLFWSPQCKGKFSVGSGYMSLTSPAPETQAHVYWDESIWQAGELQTRGRISDVPLQWLQRAADFKLSGDVVFDGQWDIKLGRQMQVRAELARTRGDFSVRATDAETGVQSRVQAGLRSARVTLSNQNSQLNLTAQWDSVHAGTVDATIQTSLKVTKSPSSTDQWRWPQDAPLRGSVKARLPQLSVWSLLAPPGWRLRGTLAANLQIGGTRSQPSASGTLQADDLGLRSIVDGLEFSHGRLRARLEGMRLLVDEFMIRGAGEPNIAGKLRARGAAEWVNGKPQVQMEVKIDRLRASIHPDRQLTTSGQLQLALREQLITANGQLHVDKALIQLPESSAPKLGNDVIVRGAQSKVKRGKTAATEVSMPASRKAAKRSGKKGYGDSSPLTVWASIGIDLGNACHVQGMGIQTRLEGNLQLTANGPLSQMPQLKGTVRTADGVVRSYGQRLNINHGSIIFSGDASNPALDIVALRPIYTSDQQVGAQVLGTAMLPRISLYSQPKLPDNETLAWLLLGHAAPSTGAEAAVLQTAALALLGGKEGRGLAAQFGLDELSFDSPEEGDIANASVTLGKRLSKRLYTAYEYSLSGASGTLLIFYELSKRWTLRGRASENSGVDLIYRLTFD